MKKLIAVLIALTMVLSMSVISFASYNGQKNPADVVSTQIVSIGGGVTADVVWNKATGYTQFESSDALKLIYYGYAKEDITNANIYAKEDGTLMNWDEAWQTYYDYLVANLMTDPINVITEVKATIDGGYVETGDAISMLGQAAMGGIGGDGGSGDLSGIVDQIIGSITGGDKEPEVTTDAYVEELKALINEGADFETISTKIGDDLASGKIVVSQLPDIAKALTELIDAGEIENNETVQKILEFINSLGGEGGIEFPDFGDIKLPWDNDNSESGSFLDTILGIIGSIGDIFNPDPGTDDPSDPSDPGTDEPTEIPDTGDVSFVAVAAVAAVAGAALILTRKKNDAE